MREAEAGCSHRGRARGRGWARGAARGAPSPSRPGLSPPRGQRPRGQRRPWFSANTSRRGRRSARAPPRGRALGLGRGSRVTGSLHPESTRRAPPAQGRAASRVAPSSPGGRVGAPAPPVSLRAGLQMRPVAPGPAPIPAPIPTPTPTPTSTRGGSHPRGAAPAGGGEVAPGAWPLPGARSSQEAHGLGGHQAQGLWGPRA